MTTENLQENRQRSFDEDEIQDERLERAIEVMQQVKEDVAPLQADLRAKTAAAKGLIEELDLALGNYRVGKYTFSVTEREPDYREFEVKGGRQIRFHKVKED